MESLDSREKLEMMSGSLRYQNVIEAYKELHRFGRISTNDYIALLGNIVGYEGFILLESSKLEPKPNIQEMIFTSSGAALAALQNAHVARTRDGWKIEIEEVPY